MLDIIEKDLLRLRLEIDTSLFIVYFIVYFIVCFCFRVHMPSVTYLRLDGSIAPSKRFDIVNKFVYYISLAFLSILLHVL